ncbi:MAG: GMP synthase subunit A [Candidatus ainarchaeum sp.]|nr:GMP synthase subunit A [Candidatus ainarchaeum sp.]
MILIIDNGSQYTHLIKRNCRDMDQESVIMNNRNGTLEDVESMKPDKIIMSGGPSSVFTPEEKDRLTMKIVKAVWERKIDVPLLGVCWGHQMIGYVLGGKVAKGASAEYGFAKITVDNEDLIFRGMPREFNAWVSHFDEVKEAPPDFEALAHSDTCKIEAMRHKNRDIFSVQFHPEVWHTQNGEKILENFLKI